MFYKYFSVLFMSLFLISSCASTRTNESTSQYFDSSAVTLKVKTDLAMDPDIKSLNITVTTVKNNVTLSGNVYSAYQKSKAVNIARNVNGVKSVTDHLVIRKYH